MALTLIQPGMLAPSAVRLENFSADGPKRDITVLSGVNSWIYQDSYYFDMGVITAPADNMVALLLQTTPVDFNQATLGYDAGPIIQG
mgnify:CR=1 FL=1